MEWLGYKVKIKYSLTGQQEYNAIRDERKEKYILEGFCFSYCMLWVLRVVCHNVGIVCCCCWVSNTLVCSMRFIIVDFLYNEHLLTSGTVSLQPSSLTTNMTLYLLAMLHPL